MEELKALAVIIFVVFFFFAVAYGPLRDLVKLK